MNVLIWSLLPLVTLTGVGTQYTPDEHAGNPLYCDRDGTLIYDEDTAPWVAMPKWTFDRGIVQCGDWVTVYPDGWPQFSARAWDAGLLSSRTFRDGQPIVVDAPPWVATWKSPVPHVRVVNWSALARECIENGWCD